MGVLAATFAIVRPFGDGHKLTLSRVFISFKVEKPA
jgi:hypothetical protein